MGIRCRRSIAKAKKTGEDLGLNVYGYPGLSSTAQVRRRRSKLENPKTRDRTSNSVGPHTAGGGSIPFERASGLQDPGQRHQPVACWYRKLQRPAQHGRALLDEYNRLTNRFELAEPRFQYVTAEPPGTQVLGYLWARTIHCPYCAGRCHWPQLEAGARWHWREVVPHLGGGREMPAATAVSRSCALPASRAPAR